MRERIRFLRFAIGHSFMPVLAGHVRRASLVAENVYRWRNACVVGQQRAFAAPVIVTHCSQVVR